MPRILSDVAVTVAVLAGIISAVVAPARAAEPVTVQREAEPSAETRIRAMLEKPFSAKFDETPLSEVLAHITSSTGLPIAVDQEALEEASIGVDTPVSRAVSGVSLRSALGLILPQIDLTWTIDDGKLLVTTPEQASPKEIVKVYPVRDLLTAADATSSPAAKSAQLFQTIRDSVAPTTWDYEQSPDRFVAPSGSLVIPQTFAAHEQITLLLAALRKARDQQHLVEGAPRQAVSTAAQELATISVQTEAEQAAENRIRAVLKKRCAVKFEKTPLATAVRAFARSSGLPIQIDRIALENAQIKLDRPVTCELSQMSLRSALNLILAPSKLTWTIDNESLLITTPDKASELLVIKIYPVQDLLAPANPTNPRAAGFEPLRRTITTGIEPTTWSEVGSSGSVSPFMPAGSLVISQTFAIHEQVALLLAALRKTRDVQEITADATGLRLHGFRIDASESNGQPPSHIVPPPGGGMGGGVF